MTDFRCSPHDYDLACGIDLSSCEDDLLNEWGGHCDECGRLMDDGYDESIGSIDVHVAGCAEDGPSAVTGTCAACHEGLTREEFEAAVAQGEYQ